MLDQLILEITGILAIIVSFLGSSNIYLSRIVKLIVYIYS
jgi:hypothetical protein